MELDFNSINSEYENYQEIYEELAVKALNYLELNFNPVISVALVNNEFIHTMNRDYRGIDRPTDVISFAFLDGEENRQEMMNSGKTIILGDIYISIDKAIEQAKEYGHPVERELKFLFVHGLLHLLGYDHMCKEDEEIMFPLQEKILEN